MLITTHVTVKSDFVIFVYCVNAVVGGGQNNKMTLDHLCDEFFKNHVLLGNK